jgi:CheY-like chemotaxis protein
MPKAPRKVLIVEDSPVSQKLVEKMLEDNNFKLEAAYNAQECLSKAYSDPPDLILMDVILNEEDGKDVARQLLADPKTAHVPIIFITNTLGLNEDDGNRTFDIDGQKFRAFAKPLHRRRLLSAIRKEINRAIHGGELPPEK